MLGVTRYLMANMSYGADGERTAVRFSLVFTLIPTRRSGQAHLVAACLALLPATPALAEAASEPRVEGEIVVSSHARHSRGDPLSGANAASFSAAQAVDKAVLEPVAKAYEHILPAPARDGVHNVLYNLREPVIAGNFLLQHKVGKAGETVARLAINSTLGLGGLFDIARRKPFHLPHRPNGFANTMGFYGVGPGPYMFLPLLGSTTVRDLAGTVVDRATLPAMFGHALRNPAFTVPVMVLSTLDHRVASEERIIRLRESPLDLYVATREDYLRRRRVEIAALRDGTEQPEEPRDQVKLPSE